MADSDFNIIKPVEGLHNIAGLTPTDQRQHRRRQNPPGTHESACGGPEEPPDEADKTGDKESLPHDDKDDKHSIDYRA